MSERDPVREFLHDRGMSAEVVNDGAEGLVARWEQVARELERDVYPFHIEDWLDDLDGRQLVHELVTGVRGALAAALVARLADADERVRAGTEQDELCLWGDALAKRLGWREGSEWWYWRRPRRVNDDFESAPADDDEAEDTR